MRKTFVLIVQLAMMTAGSWAAYEWLVLGGKGIVFKAGGFLTLFGIYLFWIDFLSPDRERDMAHPERPSDQGGKREVEKIAAFA